MAKKKPEIQKVVDALIPSSTVTALKLSEAFRLTILGTASIWN